MVEDPHGHSGNAALSVLLGRIPIRDLIQTRERTLLYDEHTQNRTIFLATARINYNKLVAKKDRFKTITVFDRQSRSTASCLSLPSTLASGMIASFAPMTWAPRDASSYRNGWAIGGSAVMACASIPIYDWCDVGIFTELAKDSIVPSHSRLRQRAQRIYLLQWTTHSAATINSTECVRSRVDHCGRSIYYSSSNAFVGRGRLFLVAVVVVKSSQIYLTRANSSYCIVLCVRVCVCVWGCTKSRSGQFHRDKYSVEIYKVNQLDGANILEVESIFMLYSCFGWIRRQFLDGI